MYDEDALVDGHFAEIEGKKGFDCLAFCVEFWLVEDVDEWVHDGLVDSFVAVGVFGGEDGTCACVSRACG